jgi:hypothetical protein
MLFTCPAAFTAGVSDTALFYNGNSREVLPVEIDYILKKAELTML